MGFVFLKHLAYLRSARKHSKGKSAVSLFLVISVIILRSEAKELVKKQIRDSGRKPHSSKDKKQIKKLFVLKC